MYLVPLLALPQLTHYVLDGFIWRRKSNPEFPIAIKRTDPRNIPKDTKLCPCNFVSFGVFRG